MNISQNKWIPIDQLIITKVGESAMLLDSVTEQCFELNPTARQAWDLMLIGRSIPEIAEQLASQTGADSSLVESDLRELFANLHDLKLIQPTAG